MKKLNPNQAEERKWGSEQKPIQKINKTKSWLFEKICNVEKPLAKLTKQNKDNNQNQQNPERKWGHYN